MWNRRKMFHRDFSGYFWREFFRTPRGIPFFPATQISSCWCSTTHLIISRSTSIWCHRFPGINTGAPRACGKNVFSGEPGQWKPESRLLEGFTHWQRESRQPPPPKKTMNAGYPGSYVEDRVRFYRTSGKIKGSFLKSSSFFSACACELLNIPVDRGGSLRM